jgi:signal transduction histidine kinase
LKKTHDSIVIKLSDTPYIANKYFYGDSALQKEVRYYPLAQLLIVGLFIILTLYALSQKNKSTQNQVWAGMAKETAHQLGTPITSLNGWIEILKENKEAAPIVNEMEKDVQRLQLVSDRFGKIGSQPTLEEKNLVEQLEMMVSYVQKRAPSGVKLSIDSRGENEILGMISAPLFDWVIENLLKNALDSMQGKGKINLLIYNEPASVIIEITDTGKGIEKKNIKKVFNPGFTTKKRGWGLGLSLCKRIVEHYHRGSLVVKKSEINVGTTFKIILNK